MWIIPYFPLFALCCDKWLVVSDHCVWGVGGQNFQARLNKHQDTTATVNPPPLNLETLHKGTMTHKVMCPPPQLETLGGVI